VVRPHLLTWQRNMCDCHDDKQNATAPAGCVDVCSAAAAAAVLSIFLDTELDSVSCVCCWKQSGYCPAGFGCMCGRPPGWSATSNCLCVTSGCLCSCLGAVPVALEQLQSALCIPMQQNACCAQPLWQLKELPGRLLSTCSVVHRALMYQSPTSVV
jgi:hypothetical protein